ncbi:MAG: hypothetical protein GWO07_00885 [Candidatus Dadabacteria bacterium]|nr:hypothetical protein [Candidatus Dadabacteria bacterium]NIS07332.1 hypothetical protein [Candidatus Dadabacteria bacterium]NIV41276.1 hypothetical protein [Candidatus Dadabacteria bacterium]NIX14511.1 hypothetical protein [Candidatus Dadabacteria bacterium]NIY20969.1 hypothetical protein [Candidatus Dadabacteria bacterium]
MANNGLYFLDTVYNSTRDAWEIGIAYMVKDEEVKGRYKSIKVTVNVPGFRKEEQKARDIAVDKARLFLKEAADAPLEDQ